MYAYQLKHTVNEYLPMKYFAPSFIGAICGAGLFILAWHFLPAPETASMVVAKGNALNIDKVRAIKDEANENRQLSIIDDNHAKSINDTSYTIGGSLAHQRNNKFPACCYSCKNNDPRIFSFEYWRF